MVFGSKAAKAGAAAEHAARSFQEGHGLFVYRVKAKLLDIGMSGPVPQFAEQIEAIEHQGWMLDRMTFVGDERTPAGFLLFRRR
jgi:hypothetical protein